MQVADFKFVSTELKHLQTKDGKHIEAFIVRDPDGHAMLIEENDRSEVAVKINKRQQLKLEKLNGTNEFSATNNAIRNEN